MSMSFSELSECFGTVSRMISEYEIEDLYSKEVLLKDVIGGVNRLDEEGLFKVRDIVNTELERMYKR